MMRTLIKYVEYNKLPDGKKEVEAPSYYQKYIFCREHKITEAKYDEIKTKYEKKLPSPKQYYKRQLEWFLLGYAPAFKEEMK